MKSPSRKTSAAFAALVATTLAFGASLTGTALSPASAATAATPLPKTCADVDVQPGHVTCFTEVERATPKAVANTQGQRSLSPQGRVNFMYAGLQPADIQDIYGIPAGSGAGTTVALIESGSSPDLEANLATYRSSFGQPVCSKANGCLTEVNQTGGTTLPAPQDGWDTEINMDVQAVSAACPACKILVVDATDSRFSNTAVAVQTAISKGAKYISMSYGSPDYDGSAAYASNEAVFNTPGVTFVASSGDTGFAQNGSDPNAHAGLTCGPQYGGTSCAMYPSTSSHVVSAGGTSVTGSTGSWQHTAWDGTGSGCSNEFAQPDFQKTTQAIVNACANLRASSDVSALADANSGFLMYGSGQWMYGGGTSLSAPLLAAMYAEAGNNTNPFSIYKHAGAQYAGIGKTEFTDVTSGSTIGCNGTVLCTASQGWDGPTGVGTPASLAALSASAPTAKSVTLTNPNPANSTVGQAITWDASVNGGTGYTYTATGLPAGLSIDENTGIITGTPTVAGSGSVTVTATGTAQFDVTPTGSVTFSYTIDALPEVTVNPTDPGTVTTDSDTPVTWDVSVQTPGTYTYTATGLPAGLSIDENTGIITGTPTVSGEFTITVTVSGTTAGGAPANGTSQFTVTIAGNTSTTDPGTGGSTGGSTGGDNGGSTGGSTGGTGGTTDPGTGGSTGGGTGGTTDPGTGGSTGGGTGGTTDPGTGGTTDPGTGGSTGGGTGGTTDPGTGGDTGGLPGGGTGGGGNTGGTVAPPSSPKHEIVKVGATKVKGAAKIGKRLTAVVGTFHADSAHGKAIKPKATITWYINGKAIKAHGKTLKIKKAWKGKRISYRVTLTAPGYKPVTFISKKTAKVK